MSNEELSKFDKWLRDDSGLSQDLQSVVRTTKDVASIAIDAIGAVSTVVGIADFMIRIASFFGPKQPDKLAEIAALAQQIDTRVSGLTQWDMNARWNDVLGDLSNASAMLHDFVSGTTVSQGTRPDLLQDHDRDRLYDNVITMLRSVRLRVLPPVQNEPAACQQAIYEQGKYGARPWTFYAEHLHEEKMSAVALAVRGLPQVDGVAWVGELPNGTPIWDYRRALPHIFRLVSELLTAFKIYDPLFLSTQRFRDDIQSIVDDLDIFAARWFQCFGWSRNPPWSDRYPDSSLDDVYAPMAFDSRSQLHVDAYTEHPERASELTEKPWVVHPIPPDPLYSNLRSQYAEKVLAYSGFNDFRAWIEVLRALTKPPTTSESVQADTRIVGSRTFKGAGSVKFAGVTQNVKLYHVNWLVTMDLVLQPQLPPYDYAKSLPIRYSFFLESYERDPSPSDVVPPALLQRTPLSAGQHILNFRVFSPTVYVLAEDDGSYGERPAAPIDDPGFLSPRSLTALKPPVKAVNSIFGDVSGAFRGFGERPSDPITASPLVATLRSVLDSTMVSQMPWRIRTVDSKPREVSVGYGLDTGSDIRAGLVRFQAWNLPNQPNAGALYLVVEEHLPKDPVVLRSMYPVYLNPEEIWYPAYSRSRTHFPG